METSKTTLDPREELVHLYNQQYSDDLSGRGFDYIVEARRSQPGDAAELRDLARRRYEHLLEVADFMEKHGIG
ncbi:hypothetical protein [Sutterella sp.]|uniref:hypothetical protein n=1 Tax=Sutterella sp. TaxID=1981025 RepID=UPI0026DF347F|nr:hypothetical protein [Sutterella sp.]MDO5531044.1 hypothetical protein [Sutterella sp.]